jgi:plasmid stability protein
MAQLLVRDLDDALVSALKKRAAARGVSTEEEHRRILHEALARTEVKPTLIEFLLSPVGEIAPEIELELHRSREMETRDPGF